MHLERPKISWIWIPVSTEKKQHFNVITKNVLTQWHMYPHKMVDLHCITAKIFSVISNFWNWTILGFSAIPGNLLTIFPRSKVFERFGQMERTQNFLSHLLDKLCLELTHPFFYLHAFVLEWRETLTIGTTKLLPSEVEDLLRRMGKNYQGRFYHLIDKYEWLNLFLWLSI